MFCQVSFLIVAEPINAPVNMEIRILQETQQPISSHTAATAVKGPLICVDMMIHDVNVHINCSQFAVCIIQICLFNFLKTLMQAIMGMLKGSSATPPSHSPPPSPPDTPVPNPIPVVAQVSIEIG